MQGAGSVAAPPGGDRAAGRTSWFRFPIGPLLAGHALLLVGAYFLITSSAGGSSGELELGAALAAAGAGIEGAVLAKSGAIARRAALVAAAGSAGRSPAFPPVGPSICLQCGWRGVPDLSRLCPRCRHPTVPGAARRAAPMRDAGE